MLLDIPAAARHLGGIGENTLRRWIKEGRVPAVRLGRRILIRQESLEKLIQTAERQPLARRRAEPATAT